MKLVRIVKGVSEIVDYDEVTAKKMIALNPDRYKTIEDFENEDGKITEKEIEEIKVEDEKDEVFEANEFLEEE